MVFSNDLVLPQKGSTMGLNYNELHTHTCSHQCDQISRLFVQYLAIYNNGNVPKKGNKFLKVCSKFCRIVNKPSGNGNILLTFSQSGEISLNLVTLVVMKNGGEASTLVWNQYFSANLSASHIQSTEYRICCWYYWIF